MMRTCVSGVCLMFVLAACGDDDDGVRLIDSGIDASHDDASVVHPGDDAAIEGTFQCDLDAGTSVETRDGWFASKLTHDVWWQGLDYLDPGRGEIEVVTLNKVESTHTTTKICGIKFPPFTDELSCKAHQLAISDDAWDSPLMPRFTIPAADGSGAATALIGIDFADGQEEREWPTSMMTGAIACEAGTGRPCYPDHDDDSFDGITGRYRIDGATYVGPYDDGHCTNGPAYTFAGVKTEPGWGEGGGNSGDVLADQVRMGLRTRVAHVGTPGSACAAGVDLRAYDCTLDPATLRVDDPRLTALDLGCKDQEAQLVDAYMPAYRALARGEAPGNSNAPLGWALINRDIDKRPSAGTRSSYVQLAGLPDGEPTCAQVRGAFHE